MNKSLYSLKKVQFKNDAFKLNVNKFEIHRGAIYMISGKLSSGKSVFLKLLNNSVKYTGYIKYEDQDLGDVDNLNKDVLYLSPQLPRSFKTVRNYIDWYIKKYDTIKKNNKEIKALVRRLGATSLLDKRIVFLTPSQKRIVSLVAAIAADPKVLIIDDLDSFLTTEELKALKSVLNRKANYDGVTIIASSYSPEHFKMSTSVFIKMDNGRITQVRSVSNKSKQ